MSKAATGTPNPAKRGRAWILPMTGPSSLKRIRFCRSGLRSRPTASLLILLALLTIPAKRTPASPPAPANQQKPKLTEQRLRERGWWPTKLDSARKDYAGTESCTACHKKIVLQQLETPMAHAAWRASETEVLGSNPKISLSAPPFQTIITNDKATNSYTVARGREAMSGRILWSIGDGVIGQTFVLQSGDRLFESQLTYFTSIRGLDTTPGHSQNAPPDIEHAFGDLQSTETAQKCFACHTTASSVRRQFDPFHALPGITCEACHGPAASHVKALQDNPAKKGKDTILDPSVLDPVELVDFCGACHRAPLDVAASKDFVPMNIRFQPYRLSKSRCWSRPDARISCTGCHNPHENLVQDIDSYDDKCLACHGVKNRNASLKSQVEPPAATPPACPVSPKHCVSCHMPQYKVPQMHGSFTDHDIRIVRPGDPYPL